MIYAILAIWGFSLIGFVYCICTAEEDETHPW